ncbi:MAG TPA: DUF1674 domain-containing protein [Rudaea sp.]|nr:DUF1674 domain-containing protein [Rudaea sp.]
MGERGSVRSGYFKHLRWQTNHRRRVALYFGRQCRREPGIDQAARESGRAMPQPGPDPIAARTPPRSEATPAPEPAQPVEIGGRDGPDPVRYGDWEKNGRCIDF